MPKFNVSVEKRLYCTGNIEVEANDSDDALCQVSNKISLGELQTTDIEWGDPEYEDSSFQTTGDVE
jgi:hypothetical protein